MKICVNLWPIVTIDKTAELLDQIVETGESSYYNALYIIATESQFDENVESAQV